jgi:L-fucose isomerase-like protein
VTKTAAIFWPGDYRAHPNQAALRMIEHATTQMEAALRHVGWSSYRVEGFLTKPHEAIERLAPIDDPMIGIYAHWVYAPHTTDGVVGKNNPLLLASNFSGRWPGLVGLLNTGASLTSLERPHSRIWTEAETWSSNERFMEQLDAWCRTGALAHDDKDLHQAPEPSPDAERAAKTISDDLRRRRPLALMLGDTSMGMINGYFGPRLLNPIGFSEHKVDQAWIIERGHTVSQSRIDDAMKFVIDRGVTFHHGEVEAEDFSPDDTREQLRDYLAVLDLVNEFKADCIGWQYQLGLIKLRPPSDLAEGLFNSVCRPESNGDTIVDATEADQGNLVPMELMKRLLKLKGLHQAVFFHDIRWGGELDGRFIWVLLNSGSSGAYAFNHDPNSLRGAHSYRQPAGYFPVPGGTFTGESLPGAITWARTYIEAGKLCTDIGYGEVVRLPLGVRDEWWNGTTRQWPLMAADLGIGRDTLMAHYQSNHIAVAYGDIFEEMVALCLQLGMRVRILRRGGVNG